MAPVQPEPPAPRPRPAPQQPASEESSIGKAIEQASRIIEELKHALDEMEEVLETLELAERQKLDDERELESLHRALRQLRRPREGGSAGGS
jgi:vacuolar-type H+-ATPase subunit I/STV1